jgi:hypothetical protein
MLSPPLQFFGSPLKRLDLRLHYFPSCPRFRIAPGFGEIVVAPAVRQGGELLSRYARLR